jgi:ATP-dependent RNA helicase DeaD
LRDTHGRDSDEIAEDREPEPAHPRTARAHPKPAGAAPAPPDRAAPRPGRRNLPAPPADMTRLFISLGKAHGVQPREIAGMLYREAGLPDGALGRITMFPHHTLVDVAGEFAEAILRATRSAKLRGRPFRVEYDRNQSE